MCRKSAAVPLSYLYKTVMCKHTTQHNDDCVWYISIFENFTFARYGPDGPNCSFYFVEKMHFEV